MPALKICVGQRSFYSVKYGRRKHVSELNARMAHHICENVVGNRKFSLLITEFEVSRTVGILAMVCRKTD
jgi:hypothetical protein